MLLIRNHSLEVLFCCDQRKVISKISRSFISMLPNGFSTKYVSSAAL